ncbi:oxygen-dependent FAD-linked oxidoreductase family, partial [Rhizoctonia solani]
MGGQPLRWVPSVIQGILDRPNTVSTGPRKSRERSGTRHCRRAFRNVWYGVRKGSWSAPKCSPSNPDSSDPNEEVPKTGALQSAPGFWAPQSPSAPTIAHNLAHMSIIDSSALSLLRQTLSPGVIHLPDDPKYSTKRWALNAERQAAVVACPATPEDVVQILLFAQGKEPYAAQKRLHVAVKGGGHTPSGASSSDGGLVIDLQPNMSVVRVEPTEKLAYVGGGALWQDVDAATAPHGKTGVCCGNCQSYWS